MCLSAGGQGNSRLQAEPNKLRQAARGLINNFSLRVNAEALVRKAKNELLHPNSTEGLWEDLDDHYGSSVESYGSRAFQESIAISRDGLMDLDDLLYHAATGEIPVPTFGFVGIDEAQDLNAAQRAILQRLLKRGGRLLAAGVVHQAICAFRGAMADSFYAVKDAFACRVLPLNVCYRCSQAVVQYVQRFVPELET